VELASANLGLNLLSFFAQWLRQGSLLRLSLFANAAFTLDYPGCSAQVQYKKHNCHVEKWHPLVGIGVSHGNLPRQSIERSQYAELLKPRDFRNQESYLPLVMNQILKRNRLLVVIAKNQPELGTHPGKPGHPLDACFRRHDERLQSESLNQGISHRRPFPNVLLNNLRRGDSFRSGVPGHHHEQPVSQPAVQAHLLEGGAQQRAHPDRNRGNRLNVT
jgi:hypothetical protein